MEKYLFVFAGLFLLFFGCSLTPPEEIISMNGQSANEPMQSGYIWNQASGKLKQISVGNSNYVWGINGTNAIYKRTGSTWTQIAGTLEQVSIGNDGDVWGITVSDDIYRRTGSTWTQISGKLKQISCGNANNIWGINDSNAIYRWTGSGWTQVAGTLKYVSVGNDGDVWGINLYADIYRRSGDKWIQIPGKLTQISVGNANNVWGVNGSNAIYKWNGSTWTQVDGALKCVSVGNDGDVWGINMYNDIYHRAVESPPVTTPNPTATSTPIVIVTPTPEPTPIDILNPAASPYILEDRGGVLSGKTVYLSAGHGKYWKSDIWKTERTQDDNDFTYLVEDDDNYRFMNEELVTLLEQAGGNVWTTRERDKKNKCEIIYTPDRYPEEKWVTATPELGKEYDGISYQTGTNLVSGSIIDTATAVWTFNTNEDFDDGDYALYVWYPIDLNQTSDAYYVIKHAEGKTALMLNQGIHGSVWRYIGTFPVKRNEQFIVTLGNHSGNYNKTVTASAVRLGGGTVSDLTGFTTDHNAPGVPTLTGNPPVWWEANAWYNLQRAYKTDSKYLDIISQHATGGRADASIRGSWAHWQHANSPGEDAIYISWHSNGLDKQKRGTFSYVVDVRKQNLPDGILQNIVHDELVNDIRKYYETDWNKWERCYTDVTDATFKKGAAPSNDNNDTGDKPWGELSTLPADVPGVSGVPGLLIEIVFHDNLYDLRAISDPYFRKIVVRALYNGIVRYFTTNAALGMPIPPDFSTTHPYNNIQCRLQTSITDPWGTSKSITRVDGSASIRIGTMHDETGHFADNRFIKQVVTAPDGIKKYYPQVGEYFTFTIPGLYQVVSTVTRGPSIASDTSMFMVN